MQVLVHIGINKTGSTSIQSALAQLPKNGATVFPYPSYRDHSDVINSAFLPPHDQRLEQRGLNRELARDENLRSLESHLQNPTVRKLVLSSENLSDLPIQSQRDLCHFFLERGCDLRVLAVIRHPVDWIRSATQQGVKTGHDAPLRKSWRAFENRLGGFVESLGSEKMLVHDFAELSTGRGGLVHQFGKLLGVELDQPLVKNTSMSLEAFAFLLAFSEALGPDRLKGQASGRNFICRTAMRLFAVEKGFTRLDTIDWSFLLDENVAKDMQWLEDVFGWSYQLEGVQYGAPVPSSDEVLGWVATDVVREMFEHLDLSFKALQDRAENFSALLRRAEAAASQGG